MAIAEDLDTAFTEGTIFDASEEDLDRFLNHLCSGHVRNEMVRHREMNRTQVINTVKTYRFIDSIQKTNKKYTLLVVILSITAIAVSCFSIWQSINSSGQTQQLINLQEKQLQELLTRHNNIELLWYNIAHEKYRSKVTKPRI